MGNASIFHGKAEKAALASSALSGAGLTSCLSDLLSSSEGLHTDSGRSLWVQGPPTPDQRQSQEQVRPLQCP